MTSRLTMSPAQRAALADALRHMAQAGVRRCDLQRTVGVKSKILGAVVRKAARP